MDMAKLIERQDAILAETSKLLADRGAPAALLARPLAVHAAQADRIKARIAALHDERDAVVKRIDSELADLEREAATVEARLTGDRKRFAPGIKAAAKPRIKAAAKPARVAAKPQAKAAAKPRAK